MSRVITYNSQSVWNVWAQFSWMIKFTLFNFMLFCCFVFICFSHCIAFLLISTSGKSELTLFLMFTSFYRGFVYKQGTIRRGIFIKIETKRRCRDDYIGSDSNVNTQVWVTVLITWSLSLCLLLQIVWYVLSIYIISVKDVRCQTCTPVSQS